MKGLAGSAGPMAVVVLGLVTGGAVGKSLLQEPSEHRLNGVDTAASPSKDTLKGSLSRNLQVVDDALDPNGTPAERARFALNQRIEFAETEFAASEGTLHFNNGDRSTAASFHKSLPHDSLGQVDPVAFDALLVCIASGDFDTCDLVPAGDPNGRLANPLAGITVEMAGAAYHALTLPPAAALNSEDLAAQMAEQYWMALARDVPFSEYGEDPLTILAADNLATMPGFADIGSIAVGPDGRADPQSQLFRSSAVGVETGPYVSQLLVKNFTIDSITVVQMLTTLAPGVDYMADYDEWLSVQNGAMPTSPEEVDPVQRFIRNSRDLATVAVTDIINTEAYRAALILIDQGAFSLPGANGPYADSDRQAGFVNYGVSHFLRLVGTAELANKSAWYQKWNVHLYVRPEAVGGTIHNILLGKIDDVEIAPSLLKNTELLDLVADRNAVITGRPRDLDPSYLLSQASREGSPTHPSYPGGHSTQNGAFATVLKALVGLERGFDCFEDPEVAAADGLTLLPFTGECLTFEGEINKLASNVALGRNILGVHWRMDSDQGLLLGETLAVRILQQEAVAYPENAGYEFRLMAGQTIRLETDGSVFIDDVQCSGDAFMGADLCV